MTNTQITEAQWADLEANGFCDFLRERMPQWTLEWKYDETIETVFSHTYIIWGGGRRFWITNDIATEKRVADNIRTMDEAKQLCQHHHWNYVLGGQEGADNFLNMLDELSERGNWPPYRQKHGLDYTFTQPSDTGKEG